jgi:DNA-binding transcriptional LysR family regulator
VLASTTDFLLAAYVLHDMAAIATVPACFAECCRLTAGLHVSPLPFDMPECEIAVSWHARDDGNVRHQWLRDVTVRAMREMLGRTPGIELTPGGAG